MAQATSQLWKDLLALPGTLREYRFLITGNGETTVYEKAAGTETGEVSHSVTHALFHSFGIGNACAAQLNLTLFADTVPRGAKIERQVRLYNPDTDTASEWLPKGVFWPNRRMEEDGLWTVDAFDAIRKAETPWEPDQSLTFPLSAQSAVAEFARLLGVEVDPRTYTAMSGTSYTVDFPTSDPDSEDGDFFTIRQELCAIAAACAGNFIMSDAGKLLLVPLRAFQMSGAASHVLGLDLVSDKDGQTLPAVSRITFSIDTEHVYTAGSDTGLELSASLEGLSQESAEAAPSIVQTALHGFMYQMFTADAVALDPAAELGDGVTVGGEDNGVTSPLISSFLAQITDDGSGFPDIAAPGEAENPDEMPKAGPVSQAISRQLARTKSYILKTANEIILGVKNELTQQFSEFRIDLTSITAEVQDPVSGLDALFEILSNRISLSVSEFTTESNRYADIVLTVDGTEHGRGRILMTGNVNVSGELSADALYAAYGDVADLLVDRLRTSRRITKYLLGDTSDDDHQFIFGETHQFISGTYTGSTEQATNPYGAPLYWEDKVHEANGELSEGVTIGMDGYPHRSDGTRIFTQTDETPYPVMQYVYHDLVKMEIAFEGESASDGGVIQTPTIVMGAGNAQGNNRAYIRKGLDGLEISYVSNTGRTIGIHGTTDGYLDLHGVRRTGALDFSSWTSGFFTERVEGDPSEHGYNVEFDETSRPVRITDDSGHVKTITWGETDPATAIFLSGVSVGQELRGWAAVAGFGSGVISGGNWAAVDLWAWAMDNGAPDGYASAAAYADYTAGLDNMQISTDKKMIWVPTVNDLANSRIILWSYYVPSSSYSTTISSENNFSGEYNYNNGSHGSFRLSFSNIDGKSFRYIAKAYGNTYCITGLRELSFRAPVTGFYQRHQTPWWSGNVTYGGGPSSVTYNYDGSSSSSRGTYLEGESIGNDASGSQQKTYDGYIYFPVFTVIPTAPDWMQVVVRPGNIPGIYGTIQQETPVKLHAGLILNENEKTLYNPITNLVYTFTAWTYDYATRTYTLTLALGGGSITVTYGENAITIDDGELYTINYLVSA